MKSIELTKPGKELRSGRRRFSRWCAALMLALTLPFAVVPPTAALAQGYGGTGGYEGGSSGGYSGSGAYESPNVAPDATGVNTNDNPGLFMQALMWIKENVYKFLKTAAAVAYKKALTYFLQKIAYDTASYIAEGGEGKKPLFEREGWGEYLKRVGDSAAGTFIESLTQSFNLPNLCAPKFDLKIKLSLGLYFAANPPDEPSCTFTQLQNNWEQFIDNPPKLDEIITASFSPFDNDIGIGIGVYSSFLTHVEQDVATAILGRETGQGIKDVVNLAGDIITPGAWIKGQVNNALDPNMLGQNYLVYTTEAVADAIDTFTSTLVAKSMKRLYEKGFGGSKPASYDWKKLEGLRSYSADSRASGSKGDEFLEFFATGMIIGDPRLNRIDVTSQLVGEGVITQSFKTAIDRKLTVRQAIDQGLIYASGAGSTFGYDKAGSQPTANDGYSYNSMIVLRKYRILPVGWELAAAYIGKLEQRQTYALNDIIQGFANPDSPFFGLVDEGWVLKAPETYCRVSGPGDSLGSSNIREETVMEVNKPPDSVTQQYPTYQYERRVVGRNNSCVDVRSCILEDDNGNCRAYGLCTEERSIWRFAGTQCPPQYTSCQSYEDTERRNFNYLDDTLDSGTCDGDTIGCQWYCRNYNVGSGIWACVNDGERVRKPCETFGRCSEIRSACIRDGDCPQDERCGGAECLVTDAATGVSCIIPYGAVSCTVPSCGSGENFVRNSGFEQPSTDLTLVGGRVAFAADWTTADVVSTAAVWRQASGVGNHISGGSFAARVDADGTRGRLIAQSSALTPPAAANPPYTVSARLYSTLLFGEAYLEVVPASGAGCTTRATDIVKGQWTTVSCSTSDNLANANVRIVLEAVSGVNPVGAVWFDDVRVERACPLKDVTVYLEGTQEQDGSKLYFDREVKACTAEESGCRALMSVSLQQTNFVYNGSFEDWPGASNVFPPGWQTGRLGVAASTVARVDDEAVVGQNYFHYTDRGGAGEDFSTEANSLIRPGRTYQVSFYAKADTANTDWRVWLDNSTVGSRQGLVSLGNGKCTILPCSDGLTACAAGSSTGDNCGGANTCQPAVSCRRDEDCRPPATPAIFGSCVSALPLTAEWQRFIFEPVEARLERENFKITFGSNTIPVTIAVDGVQAIELPARSAAVTASYMDYANNPVTYFKTPPAYLGCTGDPLTDHSSCSRYALICRADEVGCERYTPTNGEPPLPGITDASDVCPKACVDYSAFSQPATFFADAIPSAREPDFLYFIARTGRTCDASNVGCEEFTNLDEVARGGEGKASYNYLRQCTKPDAAVCRTYYTWVGSETSGYQLKTYNLRRDVGDNYPAGAGNGDMDEPDIVPIPNDDELGACATPQDAQVNPNCREFYATNGNVYYRLLRATVACSSDCHPFRLIDSSSDACEISGGYWGVCIDGGDVDTDGNTTEPLPGCVGRGGMQLVGGSDCYMQQNVCTAAPINGTFEARNQCIYQAVPSESQSCSAAQSGCREYRGNSGANLRTVLYDDFEDGDTAGWSSGTISSDAVTVGGHSITGATVSTLVVPILPGRTCDRGVATSLPACASSSEVNCSIPDSDPVRCILAAPDGQQCIAQQGQFSCGVISATVLPDHSYQLKFWARASGGVASVDVTLNGVTCDLASGGNCPLLQGRRVGTDWEEFRTDPILVTSVAPGAELRFTVAAGSVAYDFVTLTEVREYTYLIKNSWKTPAVCDTNPTLDPSVFPAPNSPQFALGCQEYSTSQGKIVDLKSFRRLCRDNAVGCQEYINTQNSASAVEERYNVGHVQSEVVVPADAFAYYVTNPDQACPATAKGCQAFGMPALSGIGEVSNYTTQYLLNNPDRYGTILCTEGNVGCKEYASPQAGTVYFRDPGSRACEYRQIPHREDYAWFIMGSASEVPDCPVATGNLGQVQPGKTCMGGDLNGTACTSDTDCSFKVCRGGAAEGSRCSETSDCQVCVGGDRNGLACGTPANCPGVGGACNAEGACEPSAGVCRAWAGMCPADFASCTAYIDPTSEPQAGILPNSNFEGFFLTCSHDQQTVCRFDSECAAASGNVKRCDGPPNSGVDCSGGDAACAGAPCVLSTCSFNKLNSWTLDEARAQHVRGAGVNKSSGVRITQLISPGVDEVAQGVGLAGGTLYTVTLSVQNTSSESKVVITAQQPIFKQFDNSVAIFAAGTMATQGDTVVLPVGGVSDVGFRRFSGRFYVTQTETGATISIQNPGTYDNVDIKPTGVYHYLASSIDRSSCNGAYNPAQGCVLVNDLSDQTLRYSTSASTAGKPPQACLPLQCIGGERSGASCAVDSDCGAGSVCRPGACDSNVLVAVSPDRTCAKWLDCIMSRQQVDFVSGGTQTFCQQIATCDRLDPVSGRCSSYPTEELKPLTFDAGSIELAQNFSGYAKVGFQWDNDTKVEGYFPYGVMTQRKLCTSGKIGQQCLEDVDCHNSDQRDGRCQPILQVGSDAAKDVIYESCRIYPRSDSPRWTAFGPVDTGEKPARSIITDILNPLSAPEFGGQHTPALLEQASECHYYQGRSELLGAYGFCVEHDPRSPYLCLNWLPVDELTGGWVGITGWRGNLRSPMFMCNESSTLEVRRTTYTTNHCYEADWDWWGYLTPAGAIAETIDNYVERSDMGCGPVSCPPGYVPNVRESNCGDFFTPGIRCYWTCTADATDFHHTDADGFSWYDYIARVDKDAALTKKHLMYCDKCGATGQVLWDPSDPNTISGLTADQMKAVPRGWLRACDKLVQVVANDGAHRAWQQRLETIQDYKGTAYVVPTLLYKKDDATPPFGSVNSLYEGGPENWPLVSDLIPAADLKTPHLPDYLGGKAGQIYFDHYYTNWKALDSGKQLANDSLREFVEMPSFNAARERLKRLFVSSYGDWRWVGTGYQEYAVPELYCAGGPLDGENCATGGAADDGKCADNYNRDASTCIKTAGHCTYYPSATPEQYKDNPDQSCTADSNCPNPFCATGRCGSFGSGSNSDDSELPCNSDAQCPRGASVNETCSVTTRVHGICQGPAGYPLEGMACSAPINGIDRCNTRSDQTGVGSCVGFDPDGAGPAVGQYGYCSFGIRQNMACQNPGDCQPADQVARCVGKCSSGSAIDEGRCIQDATCRVNGSCQETTAWLPPAQRCQNNIRPGRFTETPLDDSEGAGDWCGISPEVTNPRIENAEAPIYYIPDGSGSITFSFNVTVDPNQMPLRLLRVKWDMQDHDKAYSQNDWASGMRDKTDPRDPFKFTHNYLYEKTCDTGLLAGGAESGFCRFQIGVMVKDNWCWCTNDQFAGVNTGNLDCNACQEGTSALNDDDWGAWILPGSAQVQVCDMATPDPCRNR